MTKLYSFFKEFLLKSYEKKSTIIFYRPPQDNKYYFVYSELPIIEKKQILFNFEKEKGFVFSEFNSNKLKFIRPNIIFDGYKKKIVHKLKNDFSQSKLPKQKKNSEQNIHQKNKYIQLVNKAIQDIKKEKITKVIVATQKKKKIKIDLINSFFNACNLYPNSFVSLMVLNGQQTWLGASPEILLKKENSKTLTSHSLAATQKKNKSNQFQCFWSTKEIEEQAYVSKYLIDCFKKIRFREFDIIGPETIETGNLFHLQSKVIIDYKKLKQQKKNYGSLINLLHPTSAICGMPKKKSLKWIKKNENFNRILYCGFWGPVNINKHLMQYVNIRCFEKKDDELIFYSGAGITSKSDPQKEWKETQNKIKNIEKIIIAVNK